MPLNKLLNQDFIVNQQIPMLYKPIKGVYFLIQDNEIVYVGSSSSDVLNRILGHHKKGSIPFSNYYFLEINHDYRLIESLYIIKLHPKYNIYLGSGKSLLSKGIIYSSTISSIVKEVEKRSNANQHKSFTALLNRKIKFDQIVCLYHKGNTKIYSIQDIQALSKEFYNNDEKLINIFNSIILEIINGRN